MFFFYNFFIFVANRQMHVARLLQAVVNAVPMYADVHVEIAPRSNDGSPSTPAPTPPTANSATTVPQSAAATGGGVIDDSTNNPTSSSASGNTILNFFLFFFF